MTARKTDCFVVVQLTELSEGGRLAAQAVLNEACERIRRAFGQNVPLTVVAGRTPQPIKGKR